MKYFINVSLLKHNRNFRYLYIGQFVSFFGTMVTGVAVPYQIYHETQSTLMVGLVSLFQLVPLLFTALLGGVLADRKHRKILLLSAESIMAVGCALLMLNAAQVSTHVWVIFVVASFMSAINGLHRPALEGLIQQMVAKEDYVHVGALASFKYGVCAIAGPAIGGVIIAEVGLVSTYAIDFLSFAVSIAAICMIKGILKPKGTSEKSALSSLKEGVKYAFSRQELFGSYSVDIIAMVFGMPTALFPALAQSFGGVKTLGLLYGAPAVGALIISFMSGWTENIKRYGVAIAFSALGWGIAIILFGLSSNLPVALFFLALAGGFDAVSGIFRTTLWNETIPQEFRGRLAGIEMISYMSGPKLGDTEAGLVAAAFGVTASIVSGGVLCVVGVLTCSYFLPQFWSYQSLSKRKKEK